MPRLAITSAAAVLALAGSLFASSLALEPLIVNGQAIDGVVGNVLLTNGTGRINNSGQWTATFVAIDSKSGAVGRYVASHQGIVFDPYVPFAFDDDATLPSPLGLHSAINNAGQIAYGVRGFAVDDSGGVLGVRSGIFTLDGPVVRTGDPTPLGFAYSATALNQSEFHLNDQGTLLANAQLGLTIFGGDDAVIGFEPQGDGTYAQTLHAAAARPIADGYVASAAYRALGGSFDLSNNGSVAIAGTAIGSAGVPEALHIINGEIVRTSGEISLFGGSFLSLSQTAISINHHGDHGYYGGLENDDWDTFRWAVFRNEHELIWVDDGEVEHLEGRNISNLGNLTMTNDGDLYWTARFDDALGLTHRGLFRNDELIVSSDPTIEEVTYFPDFWYDISDDGSWLMLESANLGIYRVAVPAPSSALLVTFAALPSLRRKR